MLPKERTLERIYLVTPGMAYVTLKIYYLSCVTCVCTVWLG